MDEGKEDDCGLPHAVSIRRIFALSFGNGWFVLHSGIRTFGIRHLGRYTPPTLFFRKRVWIEPN
jgi:hypothetical protein